ncbi:type II and III secretion system protein family protein [Vampirovibrio chlorellavorus]|uniref:type II and III secretion system protein family protein n=1 Tax=Vampirovibrio chlorellavorus TaxID=758823 RepID=UPI0026F32181|nr:pilus assembly protein N-terminal domain-containing protein [Vampirovibrio chlorellavorus]
MTFKKTALLGLSTLLLSGQLILPEAQALPLMASSQLQGNPQLQKMIQGPLYGSMPMSNRHAKGQKHGILDWWKNPLGLFHSTALPLMAQSTPLQSVNQAAVPLPFSKTASKPLSKGQLAGNTANGQPLPASNPGREKSLKPIVQAAKPIEATSTPNAALTRNNTPNSGPEKPGQDHRIEPDTAASQNRQPQPSAVKITYKQVFLPQAQDQKPVTPAQPKPIAVNPIFHPIYQTYDPTEHQMASKPRSKQFEAFQMLATSALDQLAMSTKTSDLVYTPALDTSGAANDTYNNRSNLRVLKSGISQKMTSVDLTIGKAEVIYLSRPASRVSVSNPEVATAVIISPTQIQLVGKAVGVANLLVWGDMVSPDHTVVDINVHKDVSVLVNQLRYVDPGIQIVPLAAEDTVILTGQAETRETAQLAVEMAKAFFGKSTNMVAPSGGNGPNSQAPGSALPGLNSNVINLLKVKGEPSTKIELVRQRLMDIDPNIHIDVVPGPDGDEKVILTGRVATASVASKALNLASVFYGQPGMKMITAQGGNDFTRMQVNSASSSSSGGGGSTANTQSGSAAGGANLLQGSVVTDATGNVISMLEIAQKPQIKCSIKFLELNKTSLNALGGSVSGMSGNTGFASWSGVQGAAPGKSISALSTQDRSGSAFSNSANRANSGFTGSNIIQSRFNEVYQNGITQVLTINNQVAAAIQALQERRQVRTLAEPTLTLLSGEQGSFLAGGEIPIAFVGGQGQVSIEYKEFGIRLNLLPNVTDDGKIQMQVAPEVSSLDQANGVSTNSVSVPAFITRRMNTTLLVEPGQSFILAGLYNQQDTDSMSRFPGLGSIPVLGTFFRNSWNSRSKSEMVVLIRPEIIYSNTGSASPQASFLPVNATPSELPKK